MMSKKYAWVMDALSKSPLSTKARAMKHFLSGKKYEVKGTIADIDAVIKCALCPNMCKFDCPVLDAEKNEATSPSGKMRIAYFIEKGLLKSRDAFELMYKCCNCDACKQWCPFDFSVGDLLKGIRADIDNKPSEILKIKEELEKEHILGKKNFDVEEKKGNILYFAGCTVLSKQNEIAEAMIKIFSKANEEYALMEEWCCGSPLYNLGFLESFKKFAEHNVKKIKESGCKTVVCSCPTCTYMFKHVYPEMGFKIKANVLHSSEYILSLIEEGKINVDFEGSCVYHDPCVLVRKLDVKEEPREILKKIGVALKEVYFNGKDTRCCGNGGQLSITNPSISEKIAKERLEELRSKAEYIITACPSCKTAFEENGGTAFDIAEVVAGIE